MVLGKVAIALLDDWLGIVMVSFIFCLFKFIVKWLIIYTELLPYGEAFFVRGGIVKAFSWNLILKLLSD